MAIKLKTKEGYKRDYISWLIAAPICFIAFIVLSIMFGPFLLGLSKDFQELEKAGKVKAGKFVSIDVDAIIDWYAESQYTRQYKGYDFSNTDAQYCLIWVDDTTFISMKVNDVSVNLSDVNRIIDETWEYLDGTAASLPAPVNFTGKLTEMEPELKVYYEEILRGLGVLGDSDYTIYYLSIDTIQPKPLIIILLVLLLGFGIASIYGLFANKKKLDVLEREGEPPSYFDNFRENPIVRNHNNDRF